jgi:secondary thiamine-phosphate synthase enzyme
MQFYKESIKFESKIQVECINLTNQVEDIIERSGIRNGQITIFSPHTTMGIIINHDEKMLLQDFTNFLYRLAPIDQKYSHDLFELTKDNKSDGRSNGHSHCKAILLGSSETIPMSKGKMLLSAQQNILAIELDGSRQRDVIVHIMGQ